MAYNLAEIDSVVGPISNFITCIYGPAGSGKTTLAMQIVSETLNQGGQVLFIDINSGLSMERLQSLVADRQQLKRLLVKKVNSFHEQEMMINKIPLLLEDFGLIIVDSITSFYRINHADYNTKRSLEMQMRILSEASHTIPVVVVNQMYDDLKKGIQRMVAEDIVGKWSDKKIQLYNKPHKIKVITVGEVKEHFYEIKEKGIILV